MTENMRSRAGWLSPEGHAALVQAAADRDVDQAVILRDLLTQYVERHLTIESQRGGVQTRFCAPPALIDRAEQLGKDQGYSYGLLIGRLVDKALVQNQSK